jgi:hypothetical protein
MFGLASDPFIQGPQKQIAENVTEKLCPELRRLGKRFHHEDTKRGKGNSGEKVQEVPNGISHKEHKNHKGPS